MIHTNPVGKLHKNIKIATIKNKISYVTIKDTKITNINKYCTKQTDPPDTVVPGLAHSGPSSCLQFSP